VDADPEPHLLTGRPISILLFYSLLHFDSTLHGIHGAGEIGHETVASRVEDPTTMRGYQPINDDPVRGEGAKGAYLVTPHEAAVAFDIRCEDRRELSFYPLAFQGSAPPNPEYSRTGREIRGPVNHSGARWRAISDADGLCRLNEIATHRLGQPSFRDLPLQALQARSQLREAMLLAEPKRWISREKGCDVSVVVVGSIDRRLKEEG
jgi:hypothetical protein